MVAYEDLVVALTNWRINQGLPTGEDAFAALETGSVDLALPVADPVELSTSEVQALEQEDIGEMPTDMAVETLDSDQDEGFESFAEDETALAASADELVAAENAEGSLEAEPDASMELSGDDSLEADEEQSLDFADDETAYGDMPQMEGMDEMDAATEIAMPDEVSELAAESAPLDDPQTEEVAVLAIEEEIATEAAADEEIHADEMSVEEVAVDVEEVALDTEAIEAEAIEAEADGEDLAVEEVNADEMSVEEVHSADFNQDEVPTRFGEEDDKESTVMGVGVDELVPPDEG